jgi:hypothetical protein
VPAPPDDPQRAPVATCSLHTELDKVKFHEFLGATDDAVIEAWLENMVM